MIGAISQISNALGVVNNLVRSPTSAAASQTAEADFSHVLSQLTSGAVQTLQHGEAMSIEGIEGKVPVQQVVESVMSAEQTLQTVIAIRDKVVAAYQQLSQMAI